MAYFLPFFFAERHVNIMILCPSLLANLTTFIISSIGLPTLPSYGTRFSNNVPSKSTAIIISIYDYEISFPMPLRIFDTTLTHKLDKQKLCHSHCSYCHRHI